MAQLEQQLEKQEKLEMSPINNQKIGLLQARMWIDPANMEISP